MTQLAKESRELPEFIYVTIEETESPPFTQGAFGSISKAKHRGRAVAVKSLLMGSTDDINTWVCVPDQSCIISIFMSPSLQGLMPRSFNSTKSQPRTRNRVRWHYPAPIGIPIRGDGVRREWTYYEVYPRS